MKRICVVMTDDTNAMAAWETVNDKKIIFHMRRNSMFIDTETLAKHVKEVYEESRLGIIVDLRKMGSEPWLVINALSVHLWKFEKYKTRSASLVTHVGKRVSCWVKDEWLERCGTTVSKLLTNANLARDFASEPANKMGGPIGFANRVQGLFAKNKNVKVQILDTKALEEQGFGLIVGMGKGAETQPSLMIIEYTPKKHDVHMCLIGKGVCFDAGGYSMKPQSAMYGMNVDKTGASICVAALKYAVDMKMDKKITVLVPLIENRVSSNAVLPGDVLTAYNGLTVEVINTDAEGRVIIADALAYACETIKPDFTIDIGTFTGWSANQHCGASFVYYTLNNELAKVIENAERKTYERSIRLPPWDEYVSYTHGTVSDLINVSKHCVGDGNMAAMFLSNFVTNDLKQRWLHIDTNHKSKNGKVTESICDGYFTITHLLGAMKRV